MANIFFPKLDDFSPPSSPNPPAIRKLKKALLKDDPEATHSSPKIPDSVVVPGVVVTIFI